MSKRAKAQKQKNETEVKRGWSRTSLRNMESIRPELRRVLEAALPTAPYDFKVICGHRGRAEQDRAYAEGRSKLKFPRSKHNAYPSNAVDLIPLPLNWEDVDMFVETAQHILAVAEELGVSMRWGGDWDMDGDWKEHAFFDGPHFELL